MLLPAFFFLMSNVTNKSLGEMGRHIYGKKNLVRCMKDGHRRSTLIRPSAAVIRNLTTPPVRIVIHSFNVLRVLPVLDIMTQTYLELGDPRPAFLAAATTSDLINREIADGSPPTSSCRCTPEEAQKLSHHCARCPSFVRCFTLIPRDEGIRICKRCETREQLYPTAVSDDKAAREYNIVKRTVYVSVFSSVRYECRSLGEDFRSEASRRYLKDCSAACFAQLPTDADADVQTYVDLYRQQTSRYEIEVQGYGVRRQPTAPSVDAIMPFGLTSDGKVRAHAPGNLAVTAAALNWAKQIHIPAFLEVLARWTCLDPVTITDQQRIDMATECAHFAALRDLVPYQNKGRSEVDPSLVAWYTAIWRSGKLPAGERIRDRRETTSHGTSVRPKNVWPQQTRERMLRLAQQIADCFGYDLPHAQDGTPWFGLAALMPKRWSWEDAAVLFNDRVQRMRLKCNRHWEMRDTAETLFIEGIYQFCSGCYPEFLGLPMVAEVSHPLGFSIAHKLTIVIKVGNPLQFSIAHKHHGQAMWTGWEPEPTDMSQRSEAGNNILFETWTTNLLKLDMDERYYEEAREIIKSVHVPLEYYDPSLPPPTRTGRGVPPLEVAAKDEDDDIEEMFEGPEVEDQADDDDGDDEEEEQEEGEEEEAVDEPAVEHVQEESGAEVEQGTEVMEIPETPPIWATPERFCTSHINIAKRE